MMMFKKAHNLKIIAVVVAGLFLNSTAYGIDLSNKFHLRVPFVTQLPRETSEKEPITGNISTGLTRLEEAMFRTSISMNDVETKRNNREFISQYVEPRSKALKIRLESKIKAELEGRGLSDKIDDVIGALQNPLDEFLWFEAWVGGRERYFLGYENALAVNVIRHILEREQQLGVANLLEEYILHEALERCMEHEDIIRLTNDIFERDPYTRPGETLLGQALRDFINTSELADIEVHTGTIPATPQELRATVDTLGADRVGIKNIFIAILEEYALEKEDAAVVNEVFRIVRERYPDMEVELLETAINVYLDRAEALLETLPDLEVLEGPIYTLVTNATHFRMRLDVSGELEDEIENRYQRVFAELNRQLREAEAASAQASRESSLISDEAGEKIYPKTVQDLLAAANAKFHLERYGVDVYLVPMETFSEIRGGRSRGIAVEGAVFIGADIEKSVNKSILLHEVIEALSIQEGISLELSHQMALIDQLASSDEAMGRLKGDPEFKVGEDTSRQEEINDWLNDPNLDEKERKRRFGIAQGIIFGISDGKWNPEDGIPDSFDVVEPGTYSKALEGDALEGARDEEGPVGSAAKGGSSVTPIEALTWKDAEDVLTYFRALPARVGAMRRIRSDLSIDELRRIIKRYSTKEETPESILSFIIDAMREIYAIREVSELLAQPAHNIIIELSEPMDNDPSKPKEAALWFLFPEQLEEIVKAAEELGAINPDRRIRVYNYGSAGGEEAYSIAVMLNRILPEHELEIVGVDIQSQDVSQLNWFSYEDLPEESRPVAGDYFYTVIPDFLGEKILALRPEHTDLVELEQADIRDLSPDGDEIDIFVANGFLGLYVEGADLDDVLQRIVERLSPGGYLFVDNYYFISEESRKAFLDAISVCVESRRLIEVKRIERKKRGRRIESGGIYRKPLVPDEIAIPPESPADGDVEGRQAGNVGPVLDAQMALDAGRHKEAYDLLMEALLGEDYVAEVFTGEAMEEVIDRLIEHYPETTEEGRILRAMRSIVEEHQYDADQTAMKATLAQTAEKVVSDALNNLSPRELEVLKLAAQGLMNSEIVSKLSPIRWKGKVKNHIGEGAVRKHLKHIYQKLGLTKTTRDKRQRAIIIALENNVVDFPDWVRNAGVKLRDILSPKEQEVLELVAKAFTNQQIAVELGRSPRTVKNHINSIGGKIRGKIESARLKPYITRHYMASLWFFQNGKYVSNTDVALVNRALEERLRSVRDDMGSMTYLMNPNKFYFGASSVAKYGLSSAKEARELKERLRLERVAMERTLRAFRLVSETKAVFRLDGVIVNDEELGVLIEEIEEGRIDFPVAISTSEDGRTTYFFDRRPEFGPLSIGCYSQELQRVIVKKLSPGERRIFDIIHNNLGDTLTVDILVKRTRLVDVEVTMYVRGLSFELGLAMRWNVPHDERIVAIQEYLLSQQRVAAEEAIAALENPDNFRIVEAAISTLLDGAAIGVSDMSLEELTRRRDELNGLMAELRVVLSSSSTLQSEGEDTVLLYGSLKRLREAIDIELARIGHLKDAVDKAEEELEQAHKKAEKEITSIEISVSDSHLSRRSKAIEDEYNISKLRNVWLRASQAYQSAISHRQTDTEGRKPGYAMAMSGVRRIIEQKKQEAEEELLQPELGISKEEPPVVDIGTKAHIIHPIIDGLIKGEISIDVVINTLPEVELQEILDALVGDIVELKLLIGVLSGFVHGSPILGSYGINNRDECVLLSRRLLDIKRVVDRELIRKRHLKKAIEKAREELAMARSRCEEMIAALPLHITKANLRRERKRIERGFQILELERKLREAENALRRQTVTKDDYGGLLRDEASALASGGERQAVPITPDELRARDVALGDDAEKIKKLLIATLEQLISIKAETLLHNGYLDDALAVYQNALAIVDTIDSLNIFSEDLPADYIQAYFSYRYIIETRIRDIEILQSPTGDLSSAIELAKYRPLEGVRGVVQRNIIGDITNDDVRTVILRSTIKRDSGEDNIIYTVLIFDNPDSDTHHLIGNADITLSEDFKLASHPSTVTFKTKESPRMGAMEKAIIGLIVHGVIQEWHSCVDPSESTQGMYARMKDDRRVQVVEREESQDEAEHPMFIVRESLTAQINAEATVGISRKAQPGRTYTDAQVFIRSATSINSTDDVLAWTETINEGNVAVILAMNMDEYRKIAAMKVEKYVEIRLVVDMEDEEINLAEHLIIRLDGEQIRRLINEVFVFYEDGIDLQTVDDILNEGTRETLRKA